VSAPLPHQTPGEDEAIDGVPVPEEGSSRTLAHVAARAQLPVHRRVAGSSAAVQAAAAAAGGFVAGAAVLGLVQRRQRGAPALTRARRPARVLGRRGSQSAGSGAGEVVQIIASRSLLVDVHLLAGPTPPGAS